jgi:hypothetical protein
VGPQAGGIDVEEDAMEVMHERVAGLDVHKATIVGAVRVQVGREVRSRKQRTREQTRHVQRIEKTLTAADIRLDSVICDISNRFLGRGVRCRL